MNTLPSGFTARPASRDDAAALAGILNDNCCYYGIERHYDAQVFTREWSSPAHDMANNLVVEDSTGRIAAYVSLWTFISPPIRTYLEPGIHHEYFDSGLGMLLTAWGEERARALLTQCPLDVQIAIGGEANEKMLYLRAMLESAGFSQMRRFYRMRIDMTEPPTEQPLPAGYHYQTYHHPEQLPTIVDVDRQAFRDHYGYTEGDFDEEVAEVGHFLESTPDFDPTLFGNVIEDSTGKMVATSWLLMQDDGDPNCAYVDGVAVLREHRGKGIALAMLTRAFARFYERDRRSVTLGVDSENLTGALRLYTKAGMRPVATSIRYEKIIRPGIDPTTRTLETTG